MAGKKIPKTMEFDGKRYTFFGSSSSEGYARTQAHHMSDNYFTEVVEIEPGELVEVDEISHVKSRRRGRWAVYIRGKRGDEKLFWRDGK